jgi:hypothetical protein
MSDLLNPDSFEVHRILAESQDQPRHPQRSALSRSGEGIETTATPTVAVLSVCPSDTHDTALERIFHGSGWSNHSKERWRLIERFTLDSAFSILQTRPVPIVLCEANLLPGTWRNMLEYVTLLPEASLLIVTSRLADERLWSEALNLGAYDVLPKPFDALEVIRTLTSAWQHWLSRHTIHSLRTNGA